MTRVAFEQRELAQWVRASPMLRHAVFCIQETVERQFGTPVLRCTSLGRTAREDKDLGGSGVHVDFTSCGGWRAIDFSMRWDRVLRVAAVVNRKLIYDPLRPHLQVVVTRRHGTGPHLHAQVHPRTEMR